MDDNGRQTAKAPPLVILASFIVVVAGMKAASSLPVPFFLAVFIAVICTPPLFWLQRKGVPKSHLRTWIRIKQPSAMGNHPFEGHQGFDGG